MITGLAHVNLTVPSGTLEQANEFYGETLGLNPTPVPELQKGTLAWCVPNPAGNFMNITSSTNWTTKCDVQS
jgi:hypothetical protein